MGQIDDSVRVSDLTRAIWRFRYIVLISTLAVTLISFIVLMFQPNVYQAKALLSPVSDKSRSALSSLAAQYGGLASLAGLNFGFPSGNQTIIGIETLKSRRFLGDFIDRHDLLISLFAADGWNYETGEIFYDEDIFDTERGEWVRDVSPSTMTNALFVSGGINSIGSLRNIQLKRNGELVIRLDLYDLLLKGDTSGDIRLQPGDVIFIPPAGRTVGVDGEVKRLATYELRNEQFAEDLLELAGGLRPTAYPEASQIERFDERRVRTIVDIDLNTSAGLATRIQADDVIRVYSVLEKKEDIVLVSGHVYRAGAFQWRPGMRLTDLTSSPYSMAVAAAAVAAF